MKELCLLGGSGSIGSQTIELIKENPSNFSLVGISVGKRVNILKEILNEFQSIKFACVSNKFDAEVLIDCYPNVTFFYGDDGLLELIRAYKYDMVVNALVGFVGFLPSVETIKNGIDLALANKESLVVGGDIINALLKEHNVHLYPIDSEHVALAKCLKNMPRNEIKRLVITASGGSFRDKTHDELKEVSVKDALKHPSWSMGQKITIDSATMMNKGFEVIEAYHLFHIPVNKISVLLHDESIIHSLVEFCDNSYLADFGPADMKVPIAYALYEMDRKEIKTKSLNLEDFSSIHFRKLDLKRYPCLAYALEAISIGGSLPCVVNAANEEAVYAFLDEKISFLEIEELIRLMMDKHVVNKNPSIEDLISINDETRKLVNEEIKRRKN